jgi:hypothetical protein
MDCGHSLMSLIVSCRLLLLLFAVTIAHIIHIICLNSPTHTARRACGATRTDAFSTPRETRERDAVSADLPSKRDPPPITTRSFAIPLLFSFTAEPVNVPRLLGGLDSWRCAGQQMARGTLSFIG